MEAQNPEPARDGPIPSHNVRCAERSRAKKSVVLQGQEGEGFKGESASQGSKEVLMREHDLSDPDFRRRLASRLISGARSRAARRGLSFTIGPEDVERMLREQDGRCDVSGLEFLFKDYAATVRHPFAPSIDRRSSKEGYDPRNVRLVCAAANIGLGEWGDEVFLPIARGAVAKANAVANSPAPPIGLQERLDAAIHLMESMSGADQRAQARRVAALRRR
jgi:hypothetical protein